MKVPKRGREIFWIYQNNPIKKSAPLTENGHYYISNLDTDDDDNDVGDGDDDDDQGSRIQFGSEDDC